MDFPLIEFYKHHLKTRQKIKHHPEPYCANFFIPKLKLVQNLIQSNDYKLVDWAHYLSDTIYHKHRLSTILISILKKAQHHHAQMIATGAYKKACTLTAHISSYLSSIFFCLFYRQFTKALKNTSNTLA